jgi:hypothetical protein
MAGERHPGPQRRKGGSELGRVTNGPCRFLKILLLLLIES